MRRFLSKLAGASLLVMQLGCSGSTAPSLAPSAEPASPFANIVGNHEMTIEIGEQCSRVLRTVQRRTYDVALEDSGHFVNIRLVGQDAGDLGGNLSRVSPPEPNVLYFNWNNDIGCLYAEVTEQGPLYVCGSGRVMLDGSTLSGVIAGAAHFEGAPTAECFGPSLLKVALVRH
jgi:hypothetical protein